MEITCIANDNKNEKVTKMLFKLLPVNRAPISEAGTWSAIKYIIPLEKEADDQN